MLVSLLLPVLLLATPSAQAESVGKVVSLQGRVLIRNADTKNPVLTVVKAGDSLERGTVLNTSSTSSAKIMLNDKTIVDVGPSTLFKVDEFLMRSDGDRQVGVTMDYGKIRTSVTKPLTGKGAFKVKTRTATMGVRGTEFVVQASLAEGASAPPSQSPGAAPPPDASASAASGPTQITVIHGKVEVAPPVLPGMPEGSKMAAPVALTAGNQLTTAAIGEDGKFTGAPQVVSLPPAELASVKAEAKQPDRTFENAVVVESNSDGSSRGGQTLASFTQSVKIDTKAVAVGPPVGIPGTVGANFGIQAPPQTQNFGGSRIRVIFRK